MDMLLQNISLMKEAFGGGRARGWGQSLVLLCTLSRPGTRHVDLRCPQPHKSLPVSASQMRGLEAYIMWPCGTPLTLARSFPPTHFLLGFPSRPHKPPLIYAATISVSLRTPSWHVCLQHTTDKLRINLGGGRNVLTLEGGILCSWG